MAIKQIELDVRNRLKEIINGKGEKPTIKQNTRVEVSHQGFLIELKIEALLTPPTDKYIGTIISLPADKAKYIDLNIGDEILFEEKHIHSIF